MSDGSDTPDQRFAAIVEALGGRAGVTFGGDEPQRRNRFGSSALKVHGKIFAMLVRDALVVKLPRQRVDALVAAGEGQRFDPRHDGRVMKEWLIVEPAFSERWLPLAREALEFVAG
jgi:TfoX/Sxy family transcriptional regulator of competence genes